MHSSISLSKLISHLSYKSIGTIEVEVEVEDGWHDTTVPLAQYVVCTFICDGYIKTKCNHLPFKSSLPSSYLHLLAPWKLCVTDLKQTHQCVSRLQEYQSLSVPHSTSARSRAARTMLNWVLLMPAVSQTCCRCVHHGLCPTSKLHQSDNLLHQQSKLLWSPKITLATVCQPVKQPQRQQPTQSFQNYARHSHTCHSRAVAPMVKVASCTELLFAVIHHSCSQSCTHPCCIRRRSRQRRAYLSHNQSCSLECYTAWAAGTIRYMRPSSHSWSHTCQRHPHSCHHSH